MTRLHRDRGAAAVEFALVAPLLLLLVVGIAEFGRAYNIQTTLTAAAREGARAMALQNRSSAAVTAAQRAAVGLNLTAGQITVEQSCPSTPSASSTPPPPARVTVRYSMTFPSGLIRRSLPLHATGVMRCNG